MKVPCQNLQKRHHAVFLATVKSSQKWLPLICGILCIHGNNRKRAGAFKKTSFMSLQSRRPVPEKCHSIMTWVIFCLRAVGLFACWAPQCKYPEALMQKKTESLLFPSHSSATRIQPQSLADFMDVHCLTFPPCWIYPLLFLLPPSRPPFPSHAIFCPAWLHARPAPPWLLTSKRLFIHQSVIRKRGPFSSALKEREGTRSEFIKKERGQVYEKRTWRRKRIRSWPQGTREPQKQKRGCSCGYSFVELLSLGVCFFFVCLFRCVQIPHAWSLSHFSCLFSSFLHSFHLSHQNKGVSRPVPSRNPSLHLCVCLFPLSSISKSHPLNFHRLCACWHFPSPPLFKVAGEPVFRSLGIAIAPLLSWSLVHTQLHKHALSLTHIHRVFLHLRVCEWFLHSVSWPCMWMPDLWIHPALQRVSQVYFFFLPPVLLFFCLRSYCLDAGFYIQAVMPSDRMEHIRSIKKEEWLWAQAIKGRSCLQTAETCTSDTTACLKTVFKCGTWNNRQD